MRRLQQNEGTIAFYQNQVRELRYQMQSLEKHYGVDYQSLHHRMNALEDGFVAKEVAKAAREEQRDAIRYRVKQALHDLGLILGLHTRGHEWTP